MPRKLRQLIKELEDAGFVNRGGKGSHRNYLHQKGVALTISGKLGDDAKPSSGKIGQTEDRGGQVMKERDRFLKIVEWSEEDKCYVGSVPGWIGACCHGDEEEKVYHQLCRIVDEWIDIYKKDGMPLPPSTVNKNYSGKFQLRTGSELHKALAIKALQSGESLNNFCISVLRKSVTTLEKSRG